MKYHTILHLTKPFAYWLATTNKCGTVFIKCSSVLPSKILAVVSKNNNKVVSCCLWDYVRLSEREKTNNSKSTELKGTQYPQHLLLWLVVKPEANETKIKT